MPDEPQSTFFSAAQIDSTKSLDRSEIARPGSPGIKIAIPLEDLSADKLLSTAPRVMFQSRELPSLGGLPIIAKLGKGGMGAVYYAVHPRLGQEWAVKVLPFDLAEKDPFAIARFMREARTAAKIASPHLVGVIDVNQDNGLYYIVMEFVHGTTAQKLISHRRDQRSLPEVTALEICVAVCAGLDAAHTQGIVHRDIKPANILIPYVKDSEELEFTHTKLADLGLARDEGHEKSLTGTHAFLGTPGFMPPEQIDDAAAAGKPADIFSLGATLYALLAERSPFYSDRLMETLRATASKPHLPLREIRPDVSDATSRLIDICLSKDASERFADAATLRAGLEMSLRALKFPAEPLPWTAIQDLPRVTGSQASGHLESHPSPLEEDSIRELLPSIFERQWDGKESAEAYANRLGLQPTRTLLLDNDIALELVLIPSGTFAMGSEDAYENDHEKPVHRVILTKPFYMGKYPVTQQQYADVMGYNLSKYKIGDRPADMVSWEDAHEFCKRLKNNSVRLPTEAEWEFACRAGTNSRCYAGNGDTALDKIAWHAENSGFRTHTVGKKLPNAFGLYDTLGNVWEWCEDVYSRYTSTIMIDPKGPTQSKGNSSRVVRGGSWNLSSKYCRPSYRLWYAPDDRSDDFGFRLALDLSLGSP